MKTTTNHNPNRLDLRNTPHQIRLNQAGRPKPTWKSPVNRKARGFSLSKILTLVNENSEEITNALNQLTDQQEMGRTHQQTHPYPDIGEQTCPATHPKDSPCSTSTPP